MNDESQWKIANIHSKHQLDRVRAAFVLVRYGFSPSIIRCTTQLHQKTVARIKEHYLSQGHPDKFGKSGHKSTPNVILSDPKTYYAYNELMVLYSRFHRADPSMQVDMEALLKAWTVYQVHLADMQEQGDLLDINSFWYLCLYLNALTASCDEEDGGRLLFSKKDHAFYYHSNRSGMAVDNSGYIELRSLKEINDKARGLKQCTA